MAELKFGRLLVCLARKLSQEDAKLLAFLYLQKENLGATDSGIDVIDKIIKRRKICNCKEDLTELKGSLSSMGRSDLITDIDAYLRDNPSLPEKISEQVTPVTSSLQEKESDTSNSTVTGIFAG